MTIANPPSIPPSAPFLRGGGEAARLILDKDWSRHPLGPPQTWPEGLQTALSLVLNSPESMILAWGPELHFFFNETYFPLLGPRVAWAMGERFDKVWADGLEQALPIIEEAMAGRPKRFVNLPWKLATDRGPEDTWWTFSYSRILDRDGNPAGLFIVTNETTDTVAGEAERRATDTRNRQILDSAIDYAIIATDLDGRVTRWNEGARRTLGWTEAQMLGQPVDRIFTPEDLAADRPRIEMRLALETGSGTDERWHLRENGERFWANGEMTPLHNADGTVGGFVKVLRDRTEQRLALETLAKSEERYRTLFEAIDDGFCIIEFFDGPHGALSDYVHVEANPGYERQTGIAGIVGKTLRAIAPDEADGWIEIYGSVLRTGKPVRFERDFGAAGRHIEVSAARIEPESRRQVSVLFRDVTARNQAEQALRASEALARENIQRVQLALTAGAIIGTWSWDIPADRFRVDEPFARAFGLDPALGRDGLSLAQVAATVHPDDQAALAIAIDEALRRGGSYVHQYRVRRADGHYYWIEANGRVDHGPDGTPLHFPGVVIDAEERRAVEAERDRAAAALRTLNETLEQRVAARTAELMQAEEQLRQSQKVEAVGQLTGGVAHDFNNLLTVIRGSIDLLRRPDVSEERRRRYLDAIADTTDRATKLTSQLLAFARRQTLKPEVFDVEASIRAIEDMVRTLTGSRITVVSDAAGCPCHVNADRSQFDTAIVNMAVNARDAMSGQGALTIRVRHADGMPAVRSHPLVPGEFVTIALTDTGSGIAADQIDRIFEPFFTTKGVGQGTGLGLSQVFGFAKQSGGDILVESEPGSGTTFTLYLPKAVDRDPARAPAATDDIVAIGEGACVLVVEDNADVGTFATQALAELGYHTVLAVDGASALVELGACGDRFDVVFSDVVMPGMSGIELAQEIGRLYPHLPVVLTSGYSTVLAERGTHGFELLQKPYSIDELSRVLRKVSDWRHRAGSDTPADLATSPAG